MVWWQAIICVSAGLLLMGPLGINVNESWIQMQQFYIKEVAFANGCLQNGGHFCLFQCVKWLRNSCPWLTASVVEAKSLHPFIKSRRGCLFNRSDAVKHYWDVLQYIEPFGCRSRVYKVPGYGHNSACRWPSTWWCWAISRHNNDYQIIHTFSGHSRMRFRKTDIIRIFHENSLYTAALNELRRQSRLLNRAINYIFAVLNL